MTPTDRAADRAADRAERAKTRAECLANAIMALRELRCASHHHYLCDVCAGERIEEYVAQALAAERARIYQRLESMGRKGSADALRADAEVSA